MDDYTEDPLIEGIAALLTKNSQGELYRTHRPSSCHAYDTHYTDPSFPPMEDPIAGPRPGLVLDGKRRLIRRIGAGTFGTVYEARNLDLYRVEAIKFLNPPWLDAAHADIQRRFIHEARAIARMPGPHLVEIYDQGTLFGTIPYFVMERLSGQTLRQRLHECPQLPYPEFFRVASRLLCALGHIHDHGVIHRDVKPANIFLTKDGLKLLDFGLAKTHGEHTSPTTVLGTLRYMAPERMIEGTAADPKADLYSAAVILYELLAGRPPYGGQPTSLGRLLHCILHQPPTPLGTLRSHLPPGLEQLVHQGMSTHRALRPDSAQQMLAQLRCIFEPTAPTLRVRPRRPATTRASTSPASPRGRRGTTTATAPTRRLPKATRAPSSAPSSAPSPARPGRRPRLTFSLMALRLALAGAAMSESYDALDRNEPAQSLLAKPIPSHMLRIAGVARD